MTFGPDCARPVGSSNDAPRVALARPANVSDPELERWVKDPDNPISFSSESPPCAFSGKIWAAADHGSYSMICAINSLGNLWGRYTTRDPQLHGPWTLADPNFATFGPANGSLLGPCGSPIVPPCAIGSISAPAFIPLGGVDQAPTDPAEWLPTHMINMAGGRGYALGRFDAVGQKFHGLPELGVQMVESMGSHANWFCAGIDHTQNRVLHIGFLQPQDMALCYDLNYSFEKQSICPLTIPRVLRFNTDMMRLTSNPPDELRLLRNGTLLQVTNMSVGPDQPFWFDSDSGSLDVELSVHLEQHPVWFSLDLLASNHSIERSTQVTIQVDAPRQSRRNVLLPSLYNRANCC